MTYFVDVTVSSKRGWFKGSDYKTILNLLKTKKVGDTIKPKTAKTKKNVVLTLTAKVDDGHERIMPDLRTDKKAVIDTDILYKWVDTDKDNLYIVSISLYVHRQIVLVGDKGTGKNFLAETISRAYQLRYDDIGCSQMTTVSDFVGKWVNIDKWVDGSLTQWLRSDGILVIDEINLSPSSILMRITTLLDFRQSFVLTEKDGERVDRTENHYLILCFNPPHTAYSGTKSLNIAFLDKFPILQLEYPTVEKEREIIKTLCGLEVSDRILLAVNHIRDLYRNSEIGDTISTRTIIKYAQDKDSIGRDKAIELHFLNRFFNSDRETVDQVFKTEMGDEK